VQVALVALVVLRLTPSFAKGGHSAGHGGGHCGHSGHGSGHAAAYHTPTSFRSSPAPAWLAPPARENPDQVWQCGVQLVVLGETPAMVQRACGPPATARQVVYQSATGEHVVDVWSYQPTGSPVRMLRFENGELVSLKAIGPS
jgi:hypothetical protein